MPVLAAVDFWLFFVVGYAVVVPLVSLLRGHRARDAATDRETADRAHREERQSHASDEEVDDALDRLRDRYARGELSDEQFERKLEVLLETETPEDARERVARGRDAAGTEADASADLERESDRRS